VNRVRHKSPQEICHAVAPIYDGADGGLKLGMLPYNRWDAEVSSFWWLSPKATNPAFQYTKFIFSWAEEDRLFVGIHVEKGFGDSFLAVKKNHDLIMTSDWTWHAFLRDLRAGAIEAALDKLAACCVPVVTIDGGYGRYDRYHYEWDLGARQLKQTDAVRGEGLVTSPGDPISCAELAEELDRYEAEEFTWLDVYVGTILEISNDSDAWGAVGVRESALRPLEQFVR
jgi:hypothetical protein